MAYAHREGLDGPDDLAVLWDPLHAAHGGLELGRVSISGHRNVDLDIVGSRTPLKLALGLGEEIRICVVKRQAID